MSVINFTRIKMSFWVETFLSGCEVYQEIEMGESSNDTLACSFLSKHIFNTLIEQAREVEEEYKPADYEAQRKIAPWNRRRNDRDFIHTKAMHMRVNFEHLSSSVVQIKSNDDLVHIEMTMFAPGGLKPYEGEYLNSYMLDHILHPIHDVALSLSEGMHGHVYQRFAQEINAIMKNGVPVDREFLKFTFETVTK